MVRQFTSPIVLPANPTTGLQATTKQYVDLAVPTGWVNVKTYGATGDGTTDDTTALQNAINATAAGGVCHLPPGVYRTSASLVVPPQVVLQGTHAVTLTYATAPANPCVIKPLAAGSWTGGTAAVIRLLNKTAGSYATDSMAQRIRHLTIDGSANTTTGMVGIQLYGYVREAVVEHVTVRNTVSDGFTCVAYSPFTGDTAAPASCKFLDCTADNCGGAGFVISGPDCMLTGCNAQGSAYVGFLLQYAPNTQLIGCRAEWASNHNYYITGGYGNGQGSGAVLMSGCSSDRANFNGLFIDSTGSAAHNITGFSSRRDGRNGGGGGGNYAGVQVTGATSPVMLDGVTVYPGVNDDGSGTSSPQFGIRAGASTFVSVDAGYIHADTAAVSDATGNTYFAVNPAVGTATGTTAAPTRVSPAAMATAAAVALKLDQLGPVSAKTANYTLTDSDGAVVFTTTSGALTATLPTAVGRAGRRLIVKKLGGATANILTIATTSSQTIDGALTEPIAIAGGFREVISDGANWHIIGGKVEPVIVALTGITTAGANISIDASVGSVYRITASASATTCTLAVPTNPIDGDVITVELLTSGIATTLTINASILLAGGAASTVVVASGKRWFGVLRYVTSVGWFLTGSAAQA